MTRRRNAWLIVATVLAIVAVLAVIGITVTIRASSTLAAEKGTAVLAAASSSAAAPIAVFIGDSYTAGVGGDGVHWASLVARAEGWTAVNLGRGGTGYTASARKVACGFDYCPPYRGMIDAVVAAHPDIVVVSGGRNDHRTYVRSNIVETYAQLRKRLPNVTIYATSPLWGNQPTPDWLTRMGTDVKTAVTEVGGTYLDLGQPILGHRELMTNDRVHPNGRGYEVIAQRVELALARAN